MEHVIQIGVNIDDEAIKKAAIEHASKMLAADLRNEIFDRVSYGRPSGLSSDAEKIIRQTTEEYKEEIINRAVEMLVDSMRRSKAYKEAISKLGE